MDEPVKLQLKPKKISGMQYTGENVEKFMAWLRKCDSRITSYSIEREFGPENFFVHSNGAAQVRVTEHVVISTNSGPIFYVYKGQWVSQDNNGRLCIHNEDEIATKYERVPE
jgi:hypothetical protein